MDLKTSQETINEFCDDERTQNSYLRPSKKSI
jgi:hypothetical protein